MCSRCCFIWRSSVGSRSCGDSSGRCCFPKGAPRTLGTACGNYCIGYGRLACRWRRRRRQYGFPRRASSRRQSRFSREAPATPTRSESASFTLLPTYSPPTEPLSRWLETYRDEISSKLLRCLARDLARAREGADWSAVERISRSLLELDPLNETATLGLAEAMARTGSKHKAMELLHAFADDVGQSHSSLALPSRLLTRRILEEAQPSTPNSSRVPLVGRAEELRSLTDAWSHARRGHCTIAAVTGEKSIGKSRALEELAELVRLDGSGVVLTARTQPADSERPMSLFSDMCGKLLALPGAAGCSPSSLPHLRRLQGALGISSDTLRVDIDAFHAEGATRRAVVDLLESVSSERPLLICVDDADQLDASSRDLIASVPEHSAYTASALCGCRQSNGSASPTARQNDSSRSLSAAITRSPLRVSHGIVSRIPRGQRHSNGASMPPRVILGTSTFSYGTRRHLPKNRLYRLISSHCSIRASSRSPLQRNTSSKPVWPLKPTAAPQQ